MFPDEDKISAAIVILSKYSGDWSWRWYSPYLIPLFLETCFGIVIFRKRVAKKLGKFLNLGVKFNFWRMCDCKWIFDKLKPKQLMLESEQQKYFQPDARFSWILSLMVNMSWQIQDVHSLMGPTSQKPQAAFAKFKYFLQWTFVSYSFWYV